MLTSISYGLGWEFYNTSCVQFSTITFYFIFLWWMSLYWIFFRWQPCWQHRWGSHQWGSWRYVNMYIHTPFLLMSFYVCHIFFFTNSCLIIVTLWTLYLIYFLYCIILCIECSLHEKFPRPHSYILISCLIYLLIVFLILTFQISLPIEHEASGINAQVVTDTSQVELPHYGEILLVIYEVIIVWW